LRRYFDRDPDGTPNGVCRERATSLLRRAGDGNEPRIPYEAQVEGHLQCFRIYAERGITSAGIAGGSPQSFRLHTAVRDAGSPVRMGFMYSEASFPALQAAGDREIDTVLTAIERAQAKTPRPDARHRIEHASVMNQSLLDRAKKAGVILVFHSYMWEHGDKLASYGEKRLAMVHPYRTAIDMGIHVAGHSDSTVSAADPLLRIQDTVTRKGENGVGYGINQRVTVEEAIKVWTLDGAYATFEENIKGSIAPGKLADFAVLRKDPRRVPPDTIKDIIVDATYVGGKNAWQAPKNALAVIHHLVPGIDFGDGDEEDNLNHDKQ
jgi:predicted amidohydrolase YtcJ